ncbi:Uma2 family endonuclease [Phormidesmis sp. 146-12]
MQATEVEKRYSPEEYLSREEQAEYKSEYQDGEIIPMTGGSLNHNEIITNLWILKSKLRGKGYRFFSSDVRLWIPKHRKFTYPDVMVIQGEPVLYQNRTDTVENPCLIIEVLSKSTEDYDKGDKFRYSRSLPQLQEYVLINQYALEVQQYTKSDHNSWIYRVYELPEEVVKFTSVEIAMTVAEIYEGISFQETNPA